MTRILAVLVFAIIGAGAPAFVAVADTDNLDIQTDRSDAFERDIAHTAEPADQNNSPVPQKTISNQGTDYEKDKHHKNCDRNTAHH